MADRPARQPTPAVQRLVHDRAAARSARDFARADAIRDELGRAGWVVRDGPAGAVLEDRLASPEEYDRLDAIKPGYAEPDTCEHSLCLVLAGWPEDVRRLVASVGATSWELLAVDVSGTGLAPLDLLPEASHATGAAVRVVTVGEDPGHAQAWTAAARLARGRTLHFIEPSLELESGVLDRLAAALDEHAPALVGPFGLDADGTNNFSPADGPRVDGLEYLLSVRRADFARVGEFDPHFRFYRMLDVDYSYQARAAGLSVLRVACGQVTRHTHRAWESTPEPERERLSRRNFNRFLDRWVRGS